MPETKPVTFTFKGYEEAACIQCFGTGEAVLVHNNSSYYILVYRVNHDDEMGVRVGDWLYAQAGEAEHEVIYRSALNALVELAMLR